MNARLPLLLLTSIILWSSCRKSHVNPGVTNTITGRFYDSINHEPYPNLKVRLAEYRPHQSFLGPVKEELIGYADETITDSAGHYKLSFTSNGDGVNYFIEYAGLANVGVSPAQPGDGYISSPNVYQQWQIKANGGAAVYNFDIFKQYYMQIRVLVHNDPYPPLNVFVGNDHFQMGSPANSVYGTNNDTTEYIQIAKNTGGFKLILTAYDPANQTWHHATDIWLNPLINRDTIQGGTYNVYPATFK